jgi:hypothetical protein
MNRSIYALVGVLTLSVVFNFYSYQERKRYEMLVLILQEKGDVQSQQVSEMTLTALNRTNENIVELAKSQGQIEGMLAVMSNRKPSDSEYSSIWHNGYYRGLSQKKDEVTKELDRLEKTVVVSEK